MPPPKAEQELQTEEQITPQQLEFKLKDVLDEYLKDCCSVGKCDEDIRNSIPTSSLSQLLSLGYDIIVEESKRARIRTATLFAQFIRMNMLPLESYCAGLEEILEQVDELTVENPKIWEYLAEMIAPLLYENILPLERLHASCEVLISQGNAGEFLGPIFKLVVSKKGSNCLASLWHSSELIFEDFMPTDDVNKFIKDNQLEFLVDGGNTSDSESALTFEQIHEKLLDFFENENSFDDISNWITMNVGDRVKDEQFIQVLATAVFENSIVELKLNDEILRKHYNILLKYIDGNLDFEVQLLSALRAHINQLENPQGVFLEVFLMLCKDSMLSHDSIGHWACNKDPAEQKQIDPSNTTGKKVYDKDFLLALRNDPKSKKKPDNLPEVLLQKDQGQIGDIITDDVASFSKSSYSGQWSPSNTTGKKVYDKDFLLALRNDPKSKKIPDNLPEVVLRKERGEIGDIITDDVPSFSKSNYSDQRSVLKTTGKKVFDKIIGCEDVKLQECHNPRQPANGLTANVAATEDEKSAFMPPQVRGGATQSFYTLRGPPPQNQTPTMGNHRHPLIHEPLGSSNMFGQWGRGANLKTSAPAPSVNMYAGLDNIGNDADKRNSMGAHYFIPRAQAPVGSAPQILTQPKHSPRVAANVHQNPQQQASQKKKIPINRPRHRSGTRSVSSFVISRKAAYEESSSSEDF